MIHAAVQLPPPIVSVQQARRLAQQILTQRQFRQTPEPLLTRVEAWIAHEVARLVAAVVSGGHGSLAGLGVSAVILAGAVVGLTRFARRVQRDPGLTPPDWSSSRRTTANWSAEADRLEADGLWRLALRCRYRALVSELAERRVIDEVPGRTAAEYLVLLERNRPATGPDFRGASELFEAVWYGNRPIGRADQQHFAELAHRVLTEVDATR